jgi:hypothetical protein
VPVPLHPLRLRQRGFNQAHLLATPRGPTAPVVPKLRSRPHGPHYLPASACSFSTTSSPPAPHSPLAPSPCTAPAPPTSKR